VSPAGPRPWGSSPAQQAAINNHDYSVKASTKSAALTLLRG